MLNDWHRVIDAKFVHKFDIIKFKVRIFDLPNMKSCWTLDTLYISEFEYQVASLKYPRHPIALWGRQKWYRNEKIAKLVRRVSSAEKGSFASQRPARPACLIVTPPLPIPRLLANAREKISLHKLFTLRVIFQSWNVVFQDASNPLTHPCFQNHDIKVVWNLDYWLGSILLIYNSTPEYLLFMSLRYESIFQWNR